MCLDYHTKDVEMRSKKRPSFTCLKLPLAKNLEILEKRQKRKGEKYGPGGRRHCNPASKAPGHQLVCLPSPPALGTVGSVAPAALPVCTPHPGAGSRLEIESELLRKGLSAQALVPCPAQWGRDSACVLQVLF